MVDQIAGTAFPHFAAAVDIANSRNLLVAWSAIDTANADLRCWHVTESAITEVTNVVLNSTDDQGLCAIGIDTTTGYWWVVYCGKSDGSETFLGLSNLYYKVSKDSGATWEPETLLTTVSRIFYNIFVVPRFSNISLPVAFITIQSFTELMVSVDRVTSRAAYVAGIV